MTCYTNGFFDQEAYPSTVLFRSVLCIHLFSVGSVVSNVALRNLVSNIFSHHWCSTSQVQLLRMTLKSGGKIIYYDCTDKLCWKKWPCIEHWVHAMI